MPQKFTSLAEKLEAYSDRSGGPDACWPWMLGRNQAGYGKVSWEKMRYRAHRAAWEVEHGPLPPGMCALHSCDNPPCINVRHLFAGTRVDNAKDRESKRRN